MAYRKKHSKKHHSSHGKGTVTFKRADGTTVSFRGRKTRPASR